VNWLNPAGGDWDTGSNWSGGVVPGPADDVTIGVAGITVTHAVAVADAVHSLHSSAGIEIDAGSVSLSSASEIDAALTVSAALAGSDLTVTGLFTLSGGTVTAIGGPATLTAAGGAWFAGVVVADGYSLVLPVGKTAEMPAFLNLVNGAQFENYGTLEIFDGNHGLGGGVGTSLDNYGAVITAVSDPVYADYINVPFNNYGTVADDEGALQIGSVGNAYTGSAGSSISGAAGTSLRIAGPTVLAASSSLATAGAVQFGAPLGAAVSLAGSYSAAATTVQSLDNSYAPASVIMTGPVGGLGDVQVSGFAVLDVSGAVLAPAARTLSSLTLQDGTLRATGDLTATASFFIDGRPDALVAVGGPATLTVLGGASVIGGFLDGYSLVVPAGHAATITGGDITFLLDGARIENAGALTLASVDLRGDATAALDNTGSIEVSGPSYGSGPAVRIPFNNAGSVALDTGASLVIDTVPFTGYAGSSITGAVGSAITFAGPTALAAGSSLATAGAVQFAAHLGAGVSVAGSYSAAATSVRPVYVPYATDPAVLTGPVGGLGDVTVLGYPAFAVLDVSGAVLAPAARTLGGLHLESGSLRATGDLTATASFYIDRRPDSLVAVGGPATLTVLGGASVSGGFLDGYSLAVPAGHAATVTGGDVTFLLDGARIENAGALTLAGADLRGDAAAALDNTGSIRVDGAGYPGNGSAVRVPFNNLGSVTLDATFFLLVDSVPFTNAGTVDIIGGPLQFYPASNTYVQTAGSTILDGGNLAGTIDIEGGVLMGNGTVFGSVHNAGQVSPGFSPGLITISGDYTQTALGSYAVEIGGLNAGTQYDQLSVSGNEALAGALNVTLVNGFVPSLGESFTILHNTSGTAMSGTFAGLPDGTTINGTFRINYVGGDVVLTYTPSSLSGTVFADFNDDGQVDFGEKGISGVQISLTGKDDLGNAVNLSQTTDSDGSYGFLNLRPGNYYLTETQPAGWLQGIDTVGTAGGTLISTDQFFIQLAAGVDGMNYNYGEQPGSTGAVQKGQAAGIGFWNNKNGQALIKSFNGGTGHQLADWLAATLPNTFGIHAGSNNVAGWSNAQIAALFQQDFLLKGVKLDAQVLATALNVYATNATLDATGVSAQYGFTVHGNGVGTAAVNVGTSGDAFGVANNTTMTVMDLLVAADAQAVNGVLYGGNATKRKEANDVFSAVNQAGGL
jgi:hypothetical protein